MYLQGAEGGQRGRLILGGTPTLLGAAQEQSSARARAARESRREHLRTRGCGDPAVRSRDKEAAGERGRGCGTARQTASDLPLRTISA